jgi:penicillin amidase
VLGKNDKITIDQMKALQTDYLSIPARTLLPMLQPVGFETALSQQAKKRLQNWNYTLDKQSIPAAIYAMWERQLMLLAGKRFVPDAIKGLVTLQLSKLIGWLQSPDAKFGTNHAAGRDAFLKESFDLAVNELKYKLGPNMDQWIYGQEKYKHITIVHPLNSIVSNAWKQKLTIGPMPRAGNGHTPGASGSVDNQVSGASFRLIVDTGDWDKAVMINTPGQSGDVSSLYYKNLFNLWAIDQYFPAYYSKEKISKVTAERILMQPVLK